MSPIDIADRVRGTQALGPEDVAARRRTLASIEEVFRAYDFPPMEFPVLEHLDRFMDYMREEYRDRLYILEDRTGRPLCLAPSVLTFAARVLAAQKTRQARPLRLSFVQPVFRYETIRRGSLRQLTQSGIEHLTPRDPPAACAEAIACAVDAAGAAGVPDVEIVLSDVGLLRATIDSLDLPRAVHAIFIRHLMTPAEKIARYLPGTDREPEDARAPISDALRDAVDKLGEDELTELTEALLAGGTDVAAYGRDPGEVARRMVRKLKRGSHKAIYADAIARLSAVQKISGATDAALAALRKKIGKDVPGASERIDSLARLFDYLSAYGVGEGRLRVDFGLIRHQGAYDGVTFELHAKGKKRADIAGGGQYDAGWANRSSEPLPGCGFAFGLERLVEAAGSADAKSPVVDCLVVIAGDVPDAAAMGVAAALRGKGLSVRLDLPSRPIKKELSQASAEKIPYVVICGEKEQAEGRIAVRDMASREEETLPVGKAVTWIAARKRKRLKR